MNNHTLNQNPTATSEPEIDAANRTLRELREIDIELAIADLDRDIRTKAGATE